MSSIWKDKPQHFAGDMIIGALYADRPPTRGVAGWTDWLLGEVLASSLHKGYVKAAAGEKLLIAAQLPFQVNKILLLGIMAPAKNPSEHRELAALYAESVKGLRPKRILVEIPGEDSALFLKSLAEELGYKAELFGYIPEAPCRI